ncbi:manganese efflux pump MntP [[Clostridium] colinum]|uniref:manganese efflux pump MntP n=1 Tax=[Clostridium] colinum TaxID=36835 RepID=UPI00202452E4|nr:manganese efflux pump MntP family protein [[Clostridium] colinum]
MSTLEIIFISISLAMDAFAVSISNGILLNKIKIKYAIKFGIFFGTFQFIMPIIGYYLTNLLGDAILAFDHWIAFILLNIIGFKMIIETFKKDEENKICDDKNILSIKNLTILSIATSIDALAIGVSFSLIKVNIISSSLIIGFIAFVFSFLGVLIGKKLGNLLSKNAERFGGLILIFIGFKILIQHLTS